LSLSTRGSRTKAGKPRIYTVGHSNRSLDDFLRLLRHAGIEVVVDVRRWPTSRRYPWFSRESLEKELAARGIEYVWKGDVLGGYRKLPEEAGDYASCFQAPGFRAFAYHLARSPEARRAVEWIEGVARERRVAVMCSERLPWRCHRKIISDALALRGYEVVHLIDVGVERRHRPAPCARPTPDGWIDYA